MWSKIMLYPIKDNLENGFLKPEYPFNVASLTYDILRCTLYVVRYNHLSLIAQLCIFWLGLLMIVYNDKHPSKTFMTLQKKIHVDELAFLDIQNRPYQ